jgi:hypothetical protein
MVAGQCMGEGDVWHFYAATDGICRATPAIGVPLFTDGGDDVPRGGALLEGVRT